MKTMQRAYWNQEKHIIIHIYEDLKLRKLGYQTTWNFVCNHVGRSFIYVYNEEE